MGVYNTRFGTSGTSTACAPPHVLYIEGSVVDLKIIFFSDLDPA
jgi:hypothetical protein